MTRLLRVALTAAVLAGPAGPLLGQTSRPASAPAGQPKIILSAEAWDLGTLWYGDPAKFALKVTNAGDAPLKLKKIRTSCHCLVAKPARKVLPPGVSTEIIIRFDTRKKTGDIRLSAQLASNDPERPNIAFPVTGTVKPVLTVAPAGTLWMSGTDPATVCSTTARLECHDQAQPFKPRIKRLDSTKFDVRLKEVTSGKVYTLEIKTRPPLAFGSNAGTVLLETGLARMPEVSIPLCAVLSRRVSVWPAVVFAPKARMEESEHKLEIRYFGDGDFKATAVHSPAKNIRAELGNPQRQPASVGVAPAVRIRQSLLLHLPPGPDMPEKGVTIKISTSDPEFKTLEVLVTGNIMEYRRARARAEGRSRRPRRRPARPTPPTTQETDTDIQVRQP